jgi:hypothetical protein
MFSSASAKVTRDRNPGQRPRPYTPASPGLTLTSPAGKPSCCAEKRLKFGP